MKTLLIRAIPALLVISALISSCSKTHDENLPKEPVPIDLSPTQLTLVQSGNSFAFDIFHKVLENEDETKNVIISPLSISYALSMTVNGANGATRTAMLDALRVNGITPDEINSSLSQLTDALLTVDKRILIEIANSVWTEKDFAVKQAFIDVLTNYYDAEAGSFDITDPAAPTKINSWIEDKTNGLIRNMIDKLNDNTVMLLINAIYFKGKWKSEFDPGETAQKSFTKPGGIQVDVPMMTQEADFKVYQGEGFVLGEFPYGQGNFVMDIILPDSQEGTSGILPSITDEAFSSWTGHLSQHEISLFLPKFKYGFKKQMKQILTDMGMGIAFTGNADFTNIAAAPPLLINDVTHQAFIETNEEGTEAAAATIVDIGITSVGPPPTTFNVNHSFIYIIREVSTNSVIFMGRVADPLAQ